MPILVEQYAREGLREVDISGKIGINVLTLSEYKNRYPGIQEALEVAKSIIDHQVENKLLEAALGFSYEERTVITEANGDVRTEVRPNMLTQTLPHKYSG